MARVYATTPGARVQVDYHGVASEYEPCYVPDDIARGLVHIEGLRVEIEQVEPSTPATVVHAQEPEPAAPRRIRPVAINPKAKE